MNAILNARAHHRRIAILERALCVLCGIIAGMLVIIVVLMLAGPS